MIRAGFTWGERGVGAGIEIQTLAVAFSNGCDRWMARRTPESRVGGRAIRDKRGKMRTLRSLEALPASSRTSAVRYSVVIGMGAGFEVSVEVRFLGGRASSKFPDFRAGRGRRGWGMYAPRMAAE